MDKNKSARLEQILKILNPLQQLQVISYININKENSLGNSGQARNYLASIEPEIEDSIIEKIVSCLTPNVKSQQLTIDLLGRKIQAKNSSDAWKKVKNSIDEGMVFVAEEGWLRTYGEDAEDCRYIFNWKVNHSEIEGSRTGTPLKYARPRLEEIRKRKIRFLLLKKEDSGLYFVSEVYSGDLDCFDFSKHNEEITAPRNFGAGWKEIEVENLSELYENGESIKEIAIRIGRSESSVIKKLVEAGYEVDEQPTAKINLYNLNDLSGLNRSWCCRSCESLFPCNKNYLCPNCSSHFDPSFESVELNVSSNERADLIKILSAQVECENDYHLYQIIKSISASVLCFVENQFGLNAYGEDAKICSMVWGSRIGRIGSSVLLATISSEEVLEFLKAARIAKMPYVIFSNDKMHGSRYDSTSASDHFMENVALANYEICDLNASGNNIVHEEEPSSKYEEVKNLYPNAWSRWSDQEHEEFIKDVSAGEGVEALSLKYQRTKGAIKSRIKKLVCDGYLSGLSVEELESEYCLSQRMIIDTLKHKKLID